MTEEQMNAVRLYVLGDPVSLEYERIPRPRPGAGEALVRVHAAAITRGELEWPEGRLPATPSYEFSGVVAAIGAGVREVNVGKAVYALRRLRPRRRRRRVHRRPGGSSGAEAAHARPH
jgi:NADPH:quinone reductase-like Zn-dependent oxidoreductase